MPEAPKSNPITNLQAAGKKVLAGIKNVYDSWMVQLEIYEYKSKICKAKYDAAIAQGFTEEQALEICTKEWPAS
jgi:hypothetical protein